MTRTRSVSSFFSIVGAEFASRKAVLFFFTFTISLTIRLACYTGLTGSDDLMYSLYAQKIAFGTYELEPNHMAIRYGVLLPVAGVYKFFGSYEWTTIAVLPFFHQLRRFWRPFSDSLWED